MTRETERMLLDLSLELSSAKDSLAAVEIFRRHLKKRFLPGQIKDRELPGSAPELAELSGNGHFKKDKNTFFYLLVLPMPVLFELRDCEQAPPTKEELQLMEKMVQFFRERMQAIADLRGLTYTDDLTGLFNQRYLEVILDREVSLAKRNDTQFSVLFLDLDHFKNVNDSHGHLIGSRLLYEVGEEIKRALRESDITFRYGGDEFVIILSHTGLDDAIFVAERIRTQIEKKRFLARENMDIRLTASIGVATVPMHAATKQQILKAADEALYGVKKAVRNRVIAATTKLKGE